MNGRRRKDEPFNPFAPNASQKARDRKDRNPRQQARAKPVENPKPAVDLAARRKEAMEALKQEGQITDNLNKDSGSKSVTKRHQISPQPKPAPKTSIKKPDDRKDRLASLRAKSAATVQFAKDAKDSVSIDEVEIEPEIESKPDDTEINLISVPEVNLDTDVFQKDDEKITPSTNVFKTIKTTINKNDKRPKRRRAADKKGGGRQPQSRKLDRRKYLEYKYVAREILDNDSINEEHRSNILGQIWAKGERTGVEDAIAFIEQKENEQILPKEIADEFKNIIRKYTTKR